MRRRDDSETYLDTRSGEVVYLTRGWSDDHGFSEEELAEGLVSGRLLPVAPLPPETEHGWMVRLRRGARGRLGSRCPVGRADAARACRGRFQATLGRFPQERLAWLACRRGRIRALVRAWFEANEIEPATEPGGSSLSTGQDAPKPYTG